MSSVAIADRPLGRSATFVVILAACLIALIGFGTRSSFGLYLEPMTVANGGTGHPALQIDELCRNWRE